MKKTLFIIFLFTALFCRAQHEKYDKVIMSFHPAFHSESEFSINCNKLKGYFDIKEKSYKEKFKITDDDRIYLLGKIDSLYIEMIINRDSIVKTGLIEFAAEDGMTVFLYVKFKESQNINYDLGNDFNRTECNIINDIFEFIRTKTNPPQYYLEQLKEYLN